MTDEMRTFKGAAAQTRAVGGHDEERTSIMGIFGKKDAAAQAADETQAMPAVKEGKKGGKKKKGRMSKVLRETVTESALAEFSKNEAFTVETPKGRRHAGWLLDTADIGGLTEKDRKNEDKGALIEAINSGRIDVMITPMLLEREMICFIPNEKTVDAMGEFSMLASAPFHPYLVSDTAEDIEGDLDKAITLADAESVIKGERTAAAVLGFEAAPATAEEPAPEAPKQAAEPDVAEPAATDIEDDLFGGEVEAPAAEEPAPESAAAEANDWVDAAVAAIEDDPFAEEETFEATYDEEEAFEAEEEEDIDFLEEAEASAEAVEATLSRVFYSGDLDMTVPVEAFDDMFMANNAFVPLVEDRGEGWLADQLADMARLANSELKGLHDENLREARAMFLDLMGQQALRIAKAVDPDDPATEFGQRMVAIEDQTQARESRRSELVSQTRAEREAEWNKRLEDIAREAADSARASYSRRYGEDHALEMASAQDEVEAAIREGREDMVRDMNAERRAYAAKLLEHGSMAILREVAAHYKSLREAEDNLYAQRIAEIRDFAESNRADEMHRVRILEEEQNQKAEVKRLHAEMDAKLASAAAEAKVREQQLSDELERVRRDAASDAAVRQKVFDDRLADYKARVESAEDSAKRSDERASSIEAAVEARHAQIHNDDQSMIVRLQKENDAMAASMRRRTIITTCFVILALIAVFCLGLMSGAAGFELMG